MLNKKTFSYFSLIFVVIVWGCSPLFTRIVNQYYSPTVNVALNAFFSFVFFAIISGKKLKNINKAYLKIAIPLGLFYSFASVLQKIGLPYTTDTQYAFLENISCVVVPVLVFFFTKKVPSPLTIIASVLCLISCFILSGIDFSTGEIKFGIGELLCALAGVFYGVNIAGTGVYAKKLDVTVFLTLSMFIEMIVATITAITLNFITVNGAPLEKFIFTFDIGTIALRLGFTLLCSVLCWLLRVLAMKSVDPTTVAVIMPLAALVTTVISVLRGAESITLSLVIGALIGLVASVLSGLGDSGKRLGVIKKIAEKPIENNLE